ncbi:MAG: GNAT family N-acetyltransferase [Chloroflexi bacterium]|nr:GNAT family N-acetyltransferase [Chloroflexota bacterium]
MPPQRRTAGATLVPAGFGELRRLLYDLTPADISALDASLGRWAELPLGRELLAGLHLPLAGTVLLELLNIEPAGLIVLERGYSSARVRALAVAPDLRRRGLARTLLIDAEAVARERAMRWIWMHIRASDATAVRCALACGFQRYRPQFLLRARSGALPVTNTDVRIERLDAQSAREAAVRWHDYEAAVGDAWCEEPARTDLRPSAPGAHDRYLLCIVGDQALGLACISEPHEATLRVDLWLDEVLWGDALEGRVLKAVVDSLQTAPDQIEFHPGSGGHLRASLELFRSMGFAPVLYEQGVFIRAVGNPPGDLHELADAPAYEDASGRGERPPIRGGSMENVLRRMRDTARAIFRS